MALAYDMTVPRTEDMQAEELVLLIPIIQCVVVVPVSVVLMCGSSPSEYCVVGFLLVLKEGRIVVFHHLPSLQRCIFWD